MILAQNNIIPPKQWYHKPDLQDDFGFTVALFLVCNGRIPPKEWEHKPILKNVYNDYTVAMHFAKNGIIPPKQWIHDTNIQDKYGQNIGIYLAYTTVPPKELLGNISAETYNGENIKSILSRLDYIFIHGEIKYYVETETKNDQCPICLSDTTEFIKTKCKHVICLQCFKTLKLQKNLQCPICKKQEQNWYYLVQNQYKIQNTNIK